MTGENLQLRLSSLELVVVTGKGGVGKSLVSAALARLLAAGGREVLAIEVDPRENLHQLFDLPPSGGEAVAVGPRLHLQHLQPREILDDVVRDKLKLGMLVRRVLESPIHHHFTEGAPGLKEAALFGKALRLLDGHVPKGVPRPQCVVLDAPASGHGVTWMAAPQLVADVVQSGPVGQMARDIARFLADPDRCGVIIVTTAEEMPIQESVELVEALDTTLTRSPEMIVVNALYPVHGPPHNDDDSSAALWRRRREINDRQLARLRSAWNGPVVELPLLALEPGPSLLGAVSGHLAAALRGVP